MIKSLCALLILVPSVSWAVKPGDQAPMLPPQIETEIKGRVVFLDFWASWCGPCRKSLPWISRLTQRFQGLNFSVVSINLDSERSKADKLLEELNISLPVIYDPNGEFPEKFGLEEMPTSYLINSSGKIAAIFPGFKDTDRVGIESSIERILGVQTK